MTSSTSDAVITIAVAEPERSRFFPTDTITDLAQLGTVQIIDDITRDSIDDYARGLAAARIVVTAWNCPPLTQVVLDAAPHLELMAHAPSSVKPFVTPESWQRGVRVTQAGDAMAPAVAETALTMTLVLLRRMHRHDHALRTGEPWTAAMHQTFGTEISGSTIGVVGASRVGRRYIDLVRTLGARVLVYDPYLEDGDTLGVNRVDLPDLLQCSNVVSLHAPLTAETEHLIGRRELAYLADGAAIVNTARAGLIDMEALRAEVTSGRIDAALDVHATEPLPDSDPWRKLPNAVLTPHIGGKTNQSRRRGGQIVAAEIRRFLSGEPLQHEITPDMLSVMG